jgi:hypothetical protein
MINFPPNATRIKVMDERGKIIWRKKDDLKDTDKPETNQKTGEFYYMYGSPGKPKVKGEAKPSNLSGMTTNEVNTVRTRRDTYINKDGPLSAAKGNIDSDEVLTSVILGLAEESASLAFERIEAERRGDPTSQISLRRVNALKAVGDTWLKKKELVANTSLDLDSKAFKIVFGHIAETFRVACDESGLRPEMTESVFAIFGRLVDDEDWIKEAKTKMEK